MAAYEGFLNVLCVGIASWPVGVRNRGGAGEYGDSQASSSHLGKVARTSLAGTGAAGSGCVNMRFCFMWGGVKAYCVTCRGEGVFTGSLNAGTYAAEILTPFPC